MACSASGVGGTAFSVSSVAFMKTMTFIAISSVAMEGPTQGRSNHFLGDVSQRKFSCSGSPGIAATHPLDTRTETRPQATALLSGEKQRAQRLARKSREQPRALSLARLNNIVVPA